MSNTTNYELKDRQPTEATVHVTVSAEDVRQEIDAVYRRYAREVRVPGFRKGHIPRAYMETRFGRETFVEEAKEELERKHLPLALEALSLRPVSTPALDDVVFSEDEGLAFDAAFSVLPDIELPDPMGLDVTVPALKDVTDEDVEATLTEIQTQFGTLAEKQGDTVEEGDIVHVREKDREWDTRVTSDNPVTRALLGRPVGSDVEIDTDLPEGKRLKTTLTIVGLRQVVLPEIDDELAKDAGFESLELLKADIREKLQEGQAQRHQELVDARLLDRLVEKTDLPLPQPFVDELVDEEIERIKNTLQASQSSMTFEEYLAARETAEDEFRKQVETSVTQRLRRELVLGRLPDALGVTISDEQLAEEARKDAEKAGEDPIRFAARLKADDRWDDYRTSKINERLFSELRASAVIAEGEEES